MPSASGAISASQDDQIAPVLESRSLAVAAAASVSLKEWVIEVKRSSTLWITQRRRDGMGGRDWIAGRYWGIRFVISWMLFEAAG